MAKALLNSNQKTYNQWLKTIKEKVRQTQLKASIAVNGALQLLIN
jgi:hypothetical protein